MTNTEKKAVEIFMAHYLILLDSDSEKSEEILISLLAIKSAIVTVETVLSLKKDVDFWEKVKQEIEKL